MMEIQQTRINLESLTVPDSARRRTSCSVAPVLLFYQDRIRHKSIRSGLAFFAVSRTNCRTDFTSVNEFPQGAAFAPWKEHRIDRRNS
jgi:hypothetical protein